MTRLADADLVHAAQGGDREALGQLYERYFDAVYDFAARMVRDRDEAADIAQETFLKAMNALGGLARGASFRSWLFSIARNTALNRLERGRRTRPLTMLDEEGELLELDVVDPSRFASPQEAAEAAAAARLVWEAAAGLDPRQLSLLDLHVRQGLDAEEIAGVLGITRNNAYVLIHRLNKAVESAISAYVLWKQAGERCPELAALLAPAAAGSMTPEVRKTVDQHAERCGDCRERRRRLAPLAVFGGLAPVAAPPGARAAGLEQLLRNPPRPSPPARRTSSSIAGGERATLPRDGHGFASPSFLRAGVLLGMAAGVLLLALVLPFSPVSLTRDDGSGERLGAVPEQTRAAGGPQTIVIPVTPSPGAGAAGSPTAPGGALSPSPAASPGGSGGGGSPAATPTATSSATPTATPTSSPSATPTPCVGVLSLPPGSDTLVVAPGGQASFQLRNAAGCPAEYSLAVSEPWLLGPAGGSVPAGGTATVTVQVLAAALPAREDDYPAQVTVTGPSTRFDVHVIGRRGGNPPSFLWATAICTPTSTTSPTATFTAQVTDDVGVVLVTAAYTLVGGERRSVELVRGAGTEWRRAEIPLGATVSGPVTFTAEDGAGRTATMEVVAVGCSS